MSSQFSPPDEGLESFLIITPQLPPHLSELKDASTAGVESVDDLDGLVLPALRQLLHLDPHLRLG